MEVRIINDRRCFVHYHDKDMLPEHIAVRMMEQNDIQGFMPFRHIQLDGEKYFRYDTGMGETLKEWIERAQYKKDVIQLLESLIFINEEIGAYLLMQEHVCMDFSFIIVNDNKCQIAYIPIEREEQGSIFQLAKNVISSVRYAMDEDFSYIFDIQNAFGRNDIKNIYDLKRWIKIVREERYDAAIQREVESNPASIAEDINIVTDMFYSKSNPVVNKPTPETESNVVKGSKDMFEGVFGDIGFSSKDKKKKEKNGANQKNTGKYRLFSKNKDKTNNNSFEENIVDKHSNLENVLPQKEIINDLDRGDFTEVFMTGAAPRLIKVTNGVEYNLTSSSYVIGSDIHNDIVIQNNKTVSRRHAQIFVNNESWYMEDLGSTNGSCINGEILRKMEPYKLYDGAKIQISNEDYIFKI